MTSHAIVQELWNYCNILDNAFIRHLVSRTPGDEQA
jgi:hypothetical protein